MSSVKERRVNMMVSMIKSDIDSVPDEVFKRRLFRTEVIGEYHFDSDCRLTYEALKTIESYKGLKYFEEPKIIYGHSGCQVTAKW